MIALAVAAALTLTALAIWAVRTIHRPIDWNGKLTKRSRTPTATSCSSAEENR